ncbi:MAG: class I SAM-dependent methyltransferase [Deltaproteobacteria bacterium]|nr:class I SAM-dependent methyltransferase [Deltaproteobacteria bacterium]
MELNKTHISRLETFLEMIKCETYPEPPAEPHLSITRKMFDYFTGKYHLASGSKILDVGCGQGLAMALFMENDFDPIGIALNRHDVIACQEKGYDVYEMDQSFLDFENETFDFIWCRHCLEHSIFPFFTLSEFFRILKPGGYLYVEVPAPDTACRHQGNINHYSVLGKSMWTELIKRSGFEILDVLDIAFKVPAGPDMYWAFIQRK